MSNHYLECRPGHPGMGHEIDKCKRSMLHGADYSVSTSPAYFLILGSEFKSSQIHSSSLLSVLDVQEA